MCTCITQKSADQNFLMARTMDFSFELDPEMVIYPRNYPIKFSKIESPLKRHYAFMGLSKNIGGYLLADGVNEKGLSVAALYFEGYAQYQEENYDATNIGAHEVVQYILATCSNAEEAIQFFVTQNIIAVKLDYLGVVPPLHWIILDSTGESYIVELTKYGVEVHENKIGVLTNSPNYEWHLTNLRNYIGMDPHQVESRVLYGQELRPFGQGSGTFGLPGDYTPPSRFVRTLYSKLSTQTADNETELVVNASHILNGVDIPKGSVITQRSSIDYTQYTSYILNKSQTYVYRLYNTLKFEKRNLNDYDLDSSTLIVENA